LAALSSQTPEARRGRGLRRAGLTAKARTEQIMGHAKNASRRNANRMAFGVKLGSDPGVNHLATNRQPVRHEVVTHVLGTFCYPCLRAGQGGSLVAGVRYIAKPTNSEALFSYRRAA